MDGTDTKEESKEFYPRSCKTDKDGNFQGGVDNSKEGKYDSIAYPKADATSEKDSFGSVSSRKEHQKVKRYGDGLGGFGDAERVDQCVHLYGTVDLRKEYSTNNQKVKIEAHRDVGNSKVVHKGDNKEKDKDRTKKEGKLHDLWGKEKDSLQFVAGGSNCNELVRKERESDRKDVHKDKAGPKDREKDCIIRDTRNAVEKQVLLSEKEILDQSTMQTNSALSQKKLKEVDVWRHAGKELGERRKERDGHAEGERPEKRTRCVDKETDEQGTDVRVVNDKEKENVSCLVQQQKELLPTDSSQVANLETHSRHCALEADRSRGKPEVVTIVYKVGECMQDLLKLRKEYESCQANKSEESSLGGPTLQVKIPGEHVTATNRQVRREQLWGTDVYTGDSDLVAVLIHMGYCRSSRNPPSPDLQDLRVNIRVLPPQDYYVSSWRNSVRSRFWGAGVGCSYRVEQCFLVKKGCKPREIQRSLTDTSTIEPTFAPISAGCTMTTRAAASNASRKQRMVKEVIILYNLCNEPWIKYSISIVADKGLKKPAFTSARLKKGEVLYLESCRHRYELCYMREKAVKSGSTQETEAGKSQNLHSDAANGEIIDLFRFSRCKKILPQKIMLQKGIPLPCDMLEVLEDNLDWEDVLWSKNGVWIGDKEYKIAKVQFVTPAHNVASLV